MDIKKDGVFAPSFGFPIKKLISERKRFYYCKSSASVPSIAYASLKAQPFSRT